MCAIGGWLLTDCQHLELSHLHQLMEVMRHRGPDDTGTFIDESASLSRARASRETLSTDVPVSYVFRVIATLA